jgi:hypothetical protein
MLSTPLVHHEPHAWRTTAETLQPKRVDSPLDQQGHPTKSLVRLSQRANMHTQTALEITDVWEGRIIGWAHVVPSGHFSGTYVDSQAKGELAKRYLVSFCHAQ